MQNKSRDLEGLFGAENEVNKDFETFEWGRPIMTQWKSSHRLVFSGYGYKDEPFLRVNDLDAQEIIYYQPLGKTFSLKKLEPRYCIGRYDLDTHLRSLCPLEIELPSDSKENICPACMEATGFNPSFYYADVVSPQQRAYNLRPHFTYLAYFSPQYVKAGISAADRGYARLLEQGARAAQIVGRFENAYDARKLEAALCAQEGILETMRLSKKTNLLAEESYDVHEAQATLKTLVDYLSKNDSLRDCGFLISEPVLDFSSTYFSGPAPSSDDLQIAEGADDACGGLCVGMVGACLIFNQHDMNFIVPIKDWESHQINLFEGEVICDYHFEPFTASLF
ncbi:MAG: DUF2797 domain-containing protein [Eggerthellaceae bacterium]|jgi:hypothetical protein